MCTIRQDLCCGSRLFYIDRDELFEVFNSAVEYIFEFFGYCLVSYLSNFLTSCLTAYRTQSLRHVRLLNSFFVRSSTDENGDIGDVTSYNPGKLTFRQLIAAVQVLSSQKEKSLGQKEEEDLSSGVALIMLSHGADTHRFVFY